MGPNLCGPVQTRTFVSIRPSTRCEPGVCRGKWVQNEDSWNPSVVIDLKPAPIDIFLTSADHGLSQRTHDTSNQNAKFQPRHNPSCLHATLQFWWPLNLWQIFAKPKGFRWGRQVSMRFCFVQGAKPGEHHSVPHYHAVLANPNLKTHLVATGPENSQSSLPEFSVWRSSSPLLPDFIPPHLVVRTHISLLLSRPNADQNTPDALN